MTENKKFFLHLCRFLGRTKAPNIKIEFSPLCLSIYWGSTIYSKIRYDETTDKITYWTIDRPNIIKNVDLNNYEYLYYISDVPYSTFKNLKNFFNLLVSCDII